MAVTLLKTLKTYMRKKSRLACVQMCCSCVHGCFVYVLFRCCGGLTSSWLA